MSITEALGRITSIQSTLAQFSAAPQRPATATASSAATGSPNTAVSAAAQLSASTPAGSASGPPAGNGTPAAEAFSGALANALTQEPAKAAVKRPSSASASPVDKVGHVKPHGTTDGSDVVATAKKYLGVPYVWGGNNPKVGLDCSSLVQHTFRDLGISLPRVARQQATVGTAVPSLSQAKPGDLLVTHGGGHIGIYLGDNKMIHAPRPGEKVSIRELFETDKDIMTIRRVVPSEAPAPPAASTSGAGALAQQQAAFAGAAS